MVNNTSKIERLGYISISQPPAPKEKPFSKTHPLVFGIEVLVKF
jgi:hypothetical protein